MIIKKNLTKKIVAVGMITVLTGGMAVSAFAENDKDKLSTLEIVEGDIEDFENFDLDMEDFELNEEDFDSIDDFEEYKEELFENNYDRYGSIENFDFDEGFDLDNYEYEFEEFENKELTEEEQNKVDELEKQLEVLSEEYFNLSLKYKPEFEKLDLEMEKLFEKQFKIGINGKNSDYDALEKELELVEQKYEDLESKAGVDKINDKIETLEEEIDSIYGFDEFNFISGKELTIEDEEKLDKLYENLEVKYEEYESEFEKLESEYLEKLNALNKKSGISDINKEISEILGFDSEDFLLMSELADFEDSFGYSENLIYGETKLLDDKTNKELENLFEKVEQIQDKNYNKFEKLEEKYELADTKEKLEQVEEEFVQLEKETGLDTIWDKIYSYFE